MREALQINYETRHDWENRHNLTVKQLRETLAQLPDDAEIMAYEGEDICIMIYDRTSGECIADIYAPPLRLKRKEG